MDLYKKLEKMSNDNKKIYVFAVTALLCFFAYGAYYNNYFLFGDITFYSHHKEFIYIPSGARWLAGIINWLTAGSNIKWLDGGLTIIFLAISVSFICEVLQLRKKLSFFLVAGVCVIHESVFFAHFYYPFGFVIVLMITCASVVVWYKEKHKLLARVIFTSLLIALSLSAYGSYTPFGITLVIIVLVTNLLKGESYRKLFFRGLEYLVSFLAGMGIYYAIVRALMVITGEQIQAYMGEDRLVTGFTIGELFQFIAIAYKKAFQYFTGIFVHWHPGYVMMPSALSVVLIIVFMIVFAMEIIKNKDKLHDVGAKALLAFLIVVFPLAAGLIYVLAFNNVHFLMLFSFAGIYMAYIKLADEVVDEGKLRTVAASIIAIGLIFAIYRGALVTNLAASRLHNLQKITERIASGVIYRVEDCEGLVGDEKVLLVGGVNDSEYYQVSERELRGPEKLLDGVPYANYTNQNSFTYDSTLREYLEYVLGCNHRVMYYGEGDSANDTKLKEAIADMPHYPLNGSVKKVDNYIVVKFKEAD